MTLEDIYFIASIFAAFSVVVSLIFVGLQVRQSNRAAVQANRLARADMSERTMRFFGDTMSELMRHPELAAAFRKVMFDDTELTPVELTQILTFLNTTLNVHRTAYLSFSDGLIDERVMQAYESNTCWYLTAPVFAREWRRMLNMQMFDDEFANYVKNRFSELYPDHPSPSTSPAVSAPEAPDSQP